MSFSRIPSHTPRTHWGPSCLLLATLSLSLAGGLPPGQALRPGSPEEREILPGEEHSYPIELSAGDLLLVDVEQEGADVEVRLLDVRSQVIGKVDGPGPFVETSTDHLAAVVDTSGLYKILVLRGSGDGPAGHYRISIEAPRPARPEDHRRVEAVRANYEASLAMYGSRDTKALQAELREKALRIWRELGEERREAETLLQLGIVYKDLEQGRAMEVLHNAARLWEGLGDRRWQARALNEAALAGIDLGRMEHVREDLDRALELARQSKDRLCERKILTNRGIVLKDSGEAAAALQDLQKALQLADELGEKDCRANTLVILGSLYQTLGNLPSALDHYRKALELPCIQKADQSHTRAAALNNLGDAHVWLGDYEKALNYYQRALDAGSRAERARTFHNMAVVHQDLGDLVKSRETFLTALSLAREVEDPELEANSRLSLGRVYLMEGRRADAFHEWEEAARIGNPEGLVALSARATAQTERGDLQGARATIERWLEVARRRSFVSWEAHSMFLLAQVQRRQKELDRAVGTIEEAVNLLESLRGRIPSPEMRALLLASRQTYYSFYIDTLMELDRLHPGKGYNARALQVSERARARSLLDLLSEASTEIRKGADPWLLQRERQLAEDVRAGDEFYRRLVHDGASPEQVEQAKQRLDNALDLHAQVEEDLRVRDQHYAALTQPEPLTAAAIQQEVLGPGALLLEYALGDERSHLWAVTAEEIHSFELPGKAKIEAPARGFYKALTARNEDAPEGETPAQKNERLRLADVKADEEALALSRLILEKVEPLLGNRRLIVVADGVLQYIPFAALPFPAAPQQRIVHRNDVVSLPSASALAVLRRELASRSPAPKTIAILADPVFESDPGLRKDQPGDKVSIRDPRRGGQPDLLALHSLPFSREEAEAIAALVPEKDQRWVALDYEASWANAMDGRLKSYRYVHFATHGILDTLRPELSRLALSLFNEKGERQNGSLTLQDVYNLELNAELVVLSACETALGKEVRGEGLIGMTRGFMYAGAARVMASLWSVDDRYTSKLMESFYRHLLKQGQDPAAALRQAQLEIARKRPSPYYWAGFSLQGEWK